MLALLQHPHIERELRDDPRRITTAVEEMLRYDPPVQLLVRLVKEDLTLGGTTVRAGDRLILLLAGANRDPHQFPDPDTFRIDRRDNRHLAFGQGIHFCIGASLARLEAREAIGALLRAMPTIACAQDPITYGESIAFRCPERLAIRF
jgi:cytochrome P450